MRISIVLPAKNESGAIGDTIAKIHALNIAKEIIVVNDGSTDSTKEIAEQAGAMVISHPYSKGNGAAIKTGARNATGDVIVFMDADGQHDPQDILRLLAKIEEGYDLVVGARQKGSQASIGRGVANKLYNSLASYMSEHKVEDLTSGFRAVRAEKFREFIYLLPNGFSYPTTSTMAFFRAGYSVTYVPIHAAKRIGKSHIHPVKDSIRFFLIIFKIATLYSPLKMFLPFAVVLFLLATGWYGYTLYEYNRFTNMSALLYTGSIMIFLMGLISEQITTLMYKKDE
ncbi:glycosyltransferase family 2 protein [Acinetobacter wuhouensis]|uniref:Glycosyltransferase family 2 protein n=1 Tax=Acinetobacter wuhouensis TaxID=1879050 RepID=A0A4Q7APG9_9GAMM|nr:glycosyltransferase family 2 protein [Acinetobacter wuhouensis]RZG49148.1 glycosyltransferase family 2 protein [Acinetobacter wuhouensis]